MKPDLRPFDLQEIKNRVRARRNELEDRRAPYSHKHHEIDKRIGVDEKTRAALVSSIAVIVKAGGDASALSAQVREIDSRLAPDREQRARLSNEWRLLNEVCKWIEYADDGLHWLIFAQSDLDRYDRVGVYAPDYHLTRKPPRSKSPQS